MAYCLRAHVQLRSKFHILLRAASQPQHCSHLLNWCYNIWRNLTASIYVLLLLFYTSNQLKFVHPIFFLHSDHLKKRFVLCFIWCVVKLIEKIYGCKFKKYFNGCVNSLKILIIYRSISSFLKLYNCIKIFRNLNNKYKW